MAFRPILESSVRGVVASAPFRALVRRSARTAHHTMFEAAGQRIVLSLPDVSELVRGALAQVSPEMAAKLPPFLETELGSEKTQHALELFIRFWQWGTILVRVAWGLWILGILLILASTLLIPRILTRLTPNLNEDKEIARGNRAVAEYFGRVVGSTIIAIGIVIAAAILGGIIAGPF